jgi:flagellar biosynthesis protein FlhB
VPADNKTEPATRQRLRRARREGDHPVSIALIRLGGFAAVVAVLPVALAAVWKQAVQLLHQALLTGASTPVHELGLRILRLATPIVGAAALGALVVGLWQTGGALSLRPLTWDWRRLAPFAGLTRAGSGGRAFSLLLPLVGTLLLAVIALRVIRSMGGALAASVGSLPATLQLTGAMCQQLLLWALLSAAALAVVDALLTHRAWQARHRMTREEVRREQREAEGDPGLKQARERAHLELGKSSELNQFASASLLVIGRPRLAVALRYDPVRDAAPRVLIQGSGILARTLESLAPVYGVPVYEDPDLARQLASLAADEEIPPAYYAAVSGALRVVMRQASTPGTPT